MMYLRTAARAVLGKPGVVEPTTREAFSFHNRLSTGYVSAKGNPGEYGFSCFRAIILKQIGPSKQPRGGNSANQQRRSRSQGRSSRPHSVSSTETLPKLRRQ
jgi:hypothetical protein